MLSFPLGPVGCHVCSEKQSSFGDCALGPKVYEIVARVHHSNTVQHQYHTGMLKGKDKQQTNIPGLFYVNKFASKSTGLVARLFQKK